MDSPDGSMSSVDSQPVCDVVYNVGVETEVPGTNGGLFKTVLVEGTGKRPVNGSKVTVHYVGTLESDGSKFDSSRDRGEYFEFTLGRGQVIKGWDKGVATMCVGEKAILRCTAAYGYGASGSPPKIPGNATLLFEVELFRWTMEEDISELRDKSIMKNLSVKGVDYEKPGYESTVKVDLRVYLGNHSEDEPGKLVCERLGWELVVGDTPMPPEFEKCLSSMRKREAATFRIASHLVTEPYDEFQIPKGQSLTYAVELHELTTVKTWTFEGQARLDEVEKRKLQGNEAFRAGNLQAAERKYRRALEFVETDSGFKDEERATVTKLRVLLWGNLAQVLLSKRTWRESLVFCNKVIDAEPQNVKGLFRRAKVHDALGDWEEAERDLKQLLTNDAQNADALALLRHVQGQRKAYEAKQKQAYKKMFA